MRFIKYVTDAGGRVVIPAIAAPQPTFQNAEEAIQLSLDQEVEVTKQINALVELARSENDYITNNFLQWFLTEQLEEVSSMDTLLKIVQRGAANLLSVEEHLARVGVKRRRARGRALTCGDAEAESWRKPKRAIPPSRFSPDCAACPRRGRERRRDDRRKVATE